MLVSMVETSGSAPRRAGARLVVLPSGQTSGTIGGGQLEWKASGMAREMLRSDAPALSFHEFALGPELGQCCGGRVKLMFELFTPALDGQVKILADKNPPFQTSGIIGAAHIERKLVAVSPVSNCAVHISGRCITEKFGEYRRPLYLFGAGHIGRELTRLLAGMPFAVTWVDARPGIFPPDTGADIRKINNPSPIDSLNDAPQDAFILIITHSHDLDFALVNKALDMGRFDFVGLIGSKTKKRRFIRRLEQNALQGAQIKQLVCPIGIDGISSKEPAIIALSITARLLREYEKRQ